MIVLACAISLNLTVVQAPPRTEDPLTLRMRIDHNMKATEEQLRRKNVSDETRRLQAEVLRDIEKLIHLMKNPPEPPDQPPAEPPKDSPPTNPPKDGGAPPQPKGTVPKDDPSGGSGSRTGEQGNNQKPKPGQGAGGRERKPGDQQPGAITSGGESRRERRNRAARSSDQTGVARAQPNVPLPGAPQPGAPGPRPGDDAGNPGSNPDQANGATMAAPRTAKLPEKMSDVHRDVWGHLPETMRQEVDHYYRERFMPRYRELLQQYYSRLAESDRSNKERK